MGLLRGKSTRQSHNLWHKNFLIAGGDSLLLTRFTVKALMHGHPQHDDLSVQYNSSSKTLLIRHELVSGALWSEKLRLQVETHCRCFVLQLKDEGCFEVLRTGHTSHSDNGSLMANEANAPLGMGNPFDGHWDARQRLKKRTGCEVVRFNRPEFW